VLIRTLQKERRGGAKEGLKGEQVKAKERLKMRKKIRKQKIAVLRQFHRSASLSVVQETVMPQTISSLLTTCT
jgi:hypothetical protein